MSQSSKRPGRLRRLALPAAALVVAGAVGLVLALALRAIARALLAPR